MKSRFASVAGFTLIELMIVVGIIGILVALAAPNFAMYQAKSRQSEAKVQLGAIFTGEKSFYSEYAVYVGSMDAIGFAPEGSKRFYALGWDGAPDTENGRYAGGLLNPSISAVNNTLDCVTATTSTLGPATGANASTFLVNAEGCILANAENFDRWSIDETKNLRNWGLGL